MTEDIHLDEAGHGHQQVHDSHLWAFLCPEELC